MKLLSESTQLQGGSTTVAEPIGDLAARREERARARTDAIFAAHGDEVERVCRALLRDPTDAEDAKQQTFLSAYRALLGGTEPRDVPAWLATIARHECYRVSAARKAAAIPALAILDEAADPADVHTQAVANLSAARLRREIRRLPSLQRDAILLREFAGLSYDELARELGVTRPAAHSLLVRARTTLRGRLKSEIAAINFLFAFASLRKLFRHFPWRSGATSVTTKAAVITLAGTAVIAGGGFVAEQELTKSAHHADAASAVTAGHAEGVPIVGALASLRRTVPAHHAPKHQAAKIGAVAATAATASTASGAAASGNGRAHGTPAPSGTHGVPLAPPASSASLARTEASGVTADSTTSAQEQQAAPTESSSASEQAPSTSAGSRNAAAPDTPATTPSTGGVSTDSSSSSSSSPPAQGAGTSSSAPSTSINPSSPPHVTQTPSTRGTSGKTKHKTPPGQAKKLAGTDVGYGQAKKLPVTGGGAAPLPPGQSKKVAGAGDTQTPSGQAGQQSTGSASSGQSAAPGQVKKTDDSTATTTKTAAGQAKKDAAASQTTTPPGQTRKQDSGATQTTTSAASSTSSTPAAADTSSSSTATAGATGTTDTSTSTDSSTAQTTTTAQGPGNGNGNANASANGNANGSANGNGSVNGNNGGGTNGTGTGGGHGHGNDGTP
jgi:RNA polymerase sigma factor (sigma-70 family)